MEHLTKETFLNKVFNYEQNQDGSLKASYPALSTSTLIGVQFCKMVAPILEELSKEYDGKINIYKVNTEEEQELAASSASEASLRCSSALPMVNLKWQ